MVVEIHWKDPIMHHVLPRTEKDNQNLQMCSVEGHVELLALT